MKLKILQIRNHNSAHAGIFASHIYISDNQVKQKLASDMFRKALNELDYNGYDECDLFSRIDFAVLDRTP